MELLLDPNAWIAFAALTSLEIVLGIDNIIVITIFVGRLPKRARQRARLIGLVLAMFLRIALLLSLVWLMKLTAPLFAIFANELSGRDLILIGGGLFLLAKSTLEIHNQLEHAQRREKRRAGASFFGVVAQIAVFDIVFSVDSVITAVGLVDDIEVMIAAIVVAVLVMMASARSVGQFVDTHPTIKMLALAFLILIGVALVAEGFELHIPRGYFYFAMAFSAAVEMLNIRMRRGSARAARSR